LVWVGPRVAIRDAGRDTGFIDAVSVQNPGLEIQFRFDHGEEARDLAVNISPP